MGRGRLFLACSDVWFRPILHAMGRGRFFLACSDVWFRPILHAMGRGRLFLACSDCVSVRSNMRWVAAGGTNDDDDDDDEKHGIPDNPPQQRTQGTNTPFGQTPHSDNINILNTKRTYARMSDGTV